MTGQTEKPQSLGSEGVPVLAVEGLSKRFGGVQAVRDVSYSMAAGSVLGVIGPNGSGKTTMINLLSGAYRPTRGSVLISGRQSTGLPAHRICALGVARTFQNPHVFKTLTVRENLSVSVRHRAGSASARRHAKYCDEWLELVGLTRLADRVAHELSGGQQKLIEFARAMVRRPLLVLMDEPFAGVHSDVKALLHRQIASLSSRGEAAFMIVSHEVPDLMSLSQSLLCMAEGQVLTSGPPQTVCSDARVIDAYLGAPAGQPA
ncbi:MAG: ABC transporter ATP-binding protein [Streptosporangiaceae bacterium]